MQLDRIGIWIANALLFGLACLFAASIVNQFLAGALETPETETAPAAAPDPPRARTWAERQVILTRNLFNASTLAPPKPVRPTPAEEEKLAATRLPLRLLGTAATEDPETSWAAVEDLEERTHRIVRPGDAVKGKARVVRVERRRIVLDNGGRREELALEEEEQAGPRPQRAAARRAARAKRRAAARRAAPNAAAAARLRKLAENRFAVPREEVDEAMRNPANLFSQARILPKYEEGRMVGVQLNAIKPDSLFARIGIESGDTIVELNGIRIDSPEQSAELLRELSQAREFNVVVAGPDGTTRTLNFVPEQ